LYSQVYRADVCLPKRAVCNLKSLRTDRIRLNWYSIYSKQKEGEKVEDLAMSNVMVPEPADPYVAANLGNVAT
jgi:hypothetical protein